MKRYRVICRGRDHYVPQYRCWFFWHDFQAACVDAGGSWRETVWFTSERQAWRHIEVYGYRSTKDIPVAFRS